MEERLTAGTIIEAEGAVSWLVEEVSFEDYGAEIRGVVEACKLSTDFLSVGERWLVVRDGGRIVGCGTVEKRGDLVHIQSLSVVKEMRQRGIARAIVNEMYEQHVGMGQTLIAMTLFFNNGVYKALGFEHMNVFIKQIDDVGQRGKHKYCTVWGKSKGGGDIMVAYEKKD